MRFLHEDFVLNSDVLVILLRFEYLNLIHDLSVCETCVSIGVAVSGGRGLLNDVCM